MADAKIALVTGANTGIGYQVVRALYSADQSYHVFVGARSPQKAQDAIRAIQKEFPSSSNKLTPIVVNIESDESIQKAYEEVEAQVGKLDALINNAGAQFDQAAAVNELTLRQSFNKSWDVNVSGTHIMTSTFVPLLLKSPSPRIIFVTSGTSTLKGTESRSLPVDLSPPAGWPKTGLSLAGYRSVKTGLNMLMREWTRILTDDGVKVFAISPGLLATNLAGNPEAMKAMGAADPAVAGPLFRDVLEGRRDEQAGFVVNRDGIQPW
ncbi:putative short chain dehydrogenase [Aspergillus stella-maris]|uniref:putative short chain dehydrogenase n=1 Tax=Aspergillus stella-maris TaxID=1810926 RepID=UPI003CCC959B